MTSTIDIELVSNWFLKLARSGGAATADECLGMQLALPPGSPDVAFEVIYETAITTMIEMVGVITKKHNADSPAFDGLLVTAAMGAFEARWLDLHDRQPVEGHA